MKKTISIAVLLLVMAIGLAAAPAAYAAGGLTVSAALDRAAKTVAVEGTIASGAGKQVTVVVRDPKGGIDYVDQTASGADGAYAFRYTLDEPIVGTYAVRVGGEGGEQATASFAYAAESTDNAPASPPPSVPPAAPPAGEGSKQLVEAAELEKPGDGGHPVVLLGAGKTELILPLQAGELVGDGPLEIRGASFAAFVPAADLRALAGLIDASGADRARLSFAAVPATAAETEALLGKPGAEGLRAAGTPYRFALSAVGADGKAYPPDAFPAPVELALPFGAEADKDLLGLYVYDEAAGAWAYAGGELDASGAGLAAGLARSGTAAVFEYGRTFADVPAGHWAYRAVNVLAAKHIATGVTAAQFAPGRDVTRAEFAALLARALGLKAASAAPFADVPGSAWSAGGIAAAYEAGLIKGRTADAFAPNDAISREEMAAMLVRAYAHAGGQGLAPGEAAGEAAPLADAGDVSRWAVADVNKAVASGLMCGVGGGRFAPAALATRAETAEALLRLLQLLRPAA